jgi:hypothetical protein
MLWSKRTCPPLVEGALRAHSVGYVLEKPQFGQHVVPAGLGELPDPGPEPVGGPFQPVGLDVAGVKGAGDLAGWRQRRWPAPLWFPPGSMGPQPLTVGPTNDAPSSVGALAANQSHPPAASLPSQASLSWRIRSAISTAGGLACRGAPIRLQALARAAIRVSVSRRRVAHSSGIAILKQPLETAPVKHPGGARHELRAAVTLGLLMSSCK